LHAIRNLVAKARRTSLVTLFEVASYAVENWCICFRLFASEASLYPHLHYLVPTIPLLKMFPGTRSRKPMSKMNASSLPLPTLEVNIKKRPARGRFISGEKGYLLHLFNQSLEDIWILDSHLREHLAVDLNLLFFLESDELAVLQAIKTQSVVEASNPEAAERTLLGATVAVSVLASLDHSFFGSAEVALATPAEAFSQLQEILSSFGGGNTSFNSGHTRWKSKQIRITFAI
jgi:hypothetical protein